MNLFSVGEFESRQQATLELQTEYLRKSIISGNQGSEPRSNVDSSRQITEQIQKSLEKVVFISAFELHCSYVRLLDTPVDC